MEYSRGARVLLNGVRYVSTRGVNKGYVFFNNEEVIDCGEEPKPEYELAELVATYDYSALAVHGYSVAVELTSYIYRGTGGADLSTYTRSELKKIAYAALYELYMNGITLPIVVDQYPDIANELAREHQLKLAILHEKGTLQHYPNTLYLEEEDGELYFEDRELGEKNEVFCSLRDISGKCRILYVSGAPTYNVSLMLFLAAGRLGGLPEALRILSEPYRLLGLDNGYISRGSRPDILVYDLRKSVKTPPLSVPEYALLRGYPPDQVFVEGDLFFDKGEPLVLLPTSIYEIAVKHESGLHGVRAN